MAACFDNSVFVSAATLLAHNYRAIVDPRRLCFSVQIDNDSRELICLHTIIPVPSRESTVHDWLDWVCNETTLSVSA